MTKKGTDTKRSDAVPEVAIFDGSLGEIQKRLNVEARRNEAKSGYAYLLVRIPKKDRKLRVLLKAAVSDLVQLSMEPSDLLAGKVTYLVNSLVLQKKEIAPHILAEARMHAEARAELIKSCDWLTSGEVSRLAGFSSINPSAQPNKWKRQHRIFAVRYQNADHYPIYALDPENGYRPVKELAEVIRVFGDTMSGWGLAFWFASVNGFLDDARPQDVLTKDPERVIAAARNEMLGIAHG